MGECSTKTCALVGASTFNARQFLSMYEAGAFDHVIAVDGGFSSLEKIGVRPDIVLGDFDSLGYIPRGIRTASFSKDKAQSDMELALKRAKNQRFDSVVVFGALGLRLDHTLANMAVFSKYSELGMKVTAIDEDVALFFLTGPDIFEAPAQETGTVSVFSMSDRCEGVFERGMKWELDDVELTNRESLGLSNELQGEAVMIGVEKGTIVVIYPL